MSNKENKTARTIQKGSKKLAGGCPASITIKTYRETQIVLGKYTSRHSHEIGNANICHSRLTRKTKDQILALLRLKVEPSRVLEIMREGSFENPADIFSGRPEIRDRLVTMTEIRNLQTVANSEFMRFDNNDAVSTLTWIEKLREENAILAFKACSDAPPLGSGLEEKGFFLVIQTEFQHAVFSKIGGYFLGIDDTHNVTQYDNTTLFSLISRDRWGHGVCVAWMIASDGKEASIRYFLQAFKERNPSTPSIIMSDFAQAQLNAIGKVYPSSKILLCWWHVLHAWQKHVSKQSEVWPLLKRWPRINCEADFDQAWLEIQQKAPPKFVQNLKTKWIPVKHMWSDIYRQGRSVYEQGDTNMLIEAWHHVLKGKFLKGKRNRRLDTLLYILTKEVSSYYAVNWERRALGFEGHDLEAQAQAQCFKKAIEIPSEDIEKIDESEYNVRSQSNRQLFYSVKLSPDSSCNCPVFVNIKFCKHIAAVHRFAELSGPDTMHETFEIDPSLLSPPEQLPRLGNGPAPPRANISLIRIVSKFQKIQAASTVTETFQDLELVMDKIIQEQGNILPSSSVKIPPNIKTSTETANVLPRLKKDSKKKNNSAESKVPGGKGKSQSSILLSQVAPQIPSTPQFQDITNYPPPSQAFSFYQAPSYPPLASQTHSTTFEAPPPPPTDYQWSITWNRFN